MFRVQCCCSVLQHLLLGISFVHHHTHYLPFLHTLTSTSPMRCLPLVTPAHRFLSGFSHRPSQNKFHCPFSAGGATAPVFLRSLYHRSSSPHSSPPIIIHLDAACRPSSFGGHSQADDASQNFHGSFSMMGIDTAHLLIEEIVALPGSRWTLINRGSFLAALYQ